MVLLLLLLLLCVLLLRPPLSSHPFVLTFGRTQQTHKRKMKGFDIRALYEQYNDREQSLSSARQVRFIAVHLLDFSVDRHAHQNAAVVTSEGR
jgi:hypothetical protein